MRVLLLLLIAISLPARVLATEFVFLDSFGNSGAVRLDNPSGVALAQDGTVWVSDYGLGRVLHFTPTGTYLGEATPRPNNWMPTGVAVLANGQVAVAGGDVWLFNSDGTGGSSLGMAGGCYGVAARPSGGFFVSRQFAGDVLAWPEVTGVASSLYAAGVSLQPTSSSSPPLFIYTTSVTSNRARRHLLSDGWIFEVGSTILGTLSGPMDIECMGAEWLLVADTGNHRVLVLNADLQYLTHFGSLASGPGQMSRPSGLAVAPDGTVFVTDLDLNRVSRFVLAPTPTVPSSWGRIKSLSR